jgi:hypothetical protein
MEMNNNKKIFILNGQKYFSRFLFNEIIKENIISYLEFAFLYKDGIYVPMWADWLDVRNHYCPR